MPQTDLVLESGEVDGLGTAGAGMVLLDAGCAFPRVAGTARGGEQAVPDVQERPRGETR